MRRTTGTDRGARARRGASATELAFVLPTLTALALGCADFGRCAYHYVAVQNAARAGAEYGIVTPYTTAGKEAWQTQIRTTAKAEMTGQTGLVADQVTVAVPDPTIESSGLRRVRVEVSYNGFTTLVSWPGIPDQPVLNAAVEMRAIR